MQDVVIPALSAVIGLSITLAIRHAIQKKSDTLRRMTLLNQHFFREHEE